MMRGAPETLETRTRVDPPVGWVVGATSTSHAREQMDRLFFRSFNMAVGIALEMTASPG